MSTRTDHVHEEVCGGVDAHEEVGEGDDGLEDGVGLALTQHAAEETLVDVCNLGIILGDHDWAARIN